MVPNGWERKPIKELCESIIDCVNKTAKHVDFVTPYKMLRTTNIRNGRVDTENVRYVEKDVYEQWIRRGAPKKGDVIFTREAPVGEAGILDDENGIFLGQRTMMYRAHPLKSDNRFLLYSLLSSYCQKQIEDFSNGGTVAHMRVPDCGEIIISTPPLLEQRKIALILSTWDRAISKTERLIDNSKLLKKALMQQLLTGAHTQRKRLLEDSGKPFEGEWEEVELGSILSIGSGKDYKHLSIGNIPVYGSGGHMLNVSDYLYDGESVCIGRKGTIDKPMFLAGKFWTVDTLYYTHSFINSLPQFIFQYFLTLKWRTYSEASGVPSLSKSIIEKLKITLPPLPEQQKIATVLVNADKEIDLLEKQLADLKKEKKALMQQLLTGKRRVKLN